MKSTYKWKRTDVSLNQSSFSTNDISIILNCSFNKAKEIKSKIIKWANKKGANYEDIRGCKIDRIHFLEYITKRYKKKLPTKSEKIVNQKYLKSNEEILNQTFVNMRDIKLLLKCPIKTAQKIYNEVKEIMIKENMEILLDHVLTSHFLNYIINCDIDIIETEENE